jgi:hypothetical protein
MSNTNAPASVLQDIQAELEAARQLEQAHPEWANEGNLSSSMIEEALGIYFTNVTATAQVYATGTAGARWTEAVDLELTTTKTPAPGTSLTPSAIPSASPKLSAATPIPTASPEPAGPLGAVEIVVIIVTTSVLMIAIGALVYLGRMRRNP